MSARSSAYLQANDDIGKEARGHSRYGVAGALRRRPMDKRPRMKRPLWIIGCVLVSALIIAILVVLPVYFGVILPQRQRMQSQINKNPFSPTGATVWLFVDYIVFSVID